MEEQLKCVLLLSLQEMALRRVAVTLWSGSNNVAALSKGRLTYLCDRVQREAIEDEIKDKILKLELPKLLTKQMNYIVRLITLEATVWKRRQLFYIWYLHNAVALPDSVKICWTTSGTINFRQTVEPLLRCDVLDVKQRYEIACDYCLKDAISLYWEELSEEEKVNYCKYKGPSMDLTYWWSCILKGEPPELDYLARNSGRNLTFHQFAFESSAHEGDKTAAEYFFQKLTSEEREASLLRTAHAVIVHRNSGRFTREKRSNLLCYLLSVMTSEQQMEIMKSHPIYVFSCFLYWPLQDLFSDNARLLWTFLPPSSYVDLVKEIVYCSRCSDIYFPKIFKEFFLESPLDFKKCFVEEFNFGSSPAFSFLDAFFQHEDSESITVMFRNLDAADRVKLVFQRRVFELFHDCLWKDRWHLVEVCLREATLSKEEKERLKDAFTEFLEREALWVNQDFQTFFYFLDETHPSSDVRVKNQKRELVAWRQKREIKDKSGN